MSAPKAAEKGAKPVRKARAAVSSPKKPVRPTTIKTDAGANDASAAAERLAAEVDRALSQGQTDLLSAEAIQALMAIACRSYSAQVEAGGNFLPLAGRSRVTSTDVMVTASGLLRSANLAVFELGMWQSWTGR